MRPRDPTRLTQPAATRVKTLHKQLELFDAMGCPTSVRTGVGRTGKTDALPDACTAYIAALRRPRPRREVSHARR